MGLPQWIIIGLVVFDLGYAAAKHGQSQGPYNFWITFVSDALVLVFLQWGGFFGTNCK